MPEPAVEKGQARGLRSADPLPDFLKVFSVQTNKTAESLGISIAAGEGRLAAVDTALHVYRPLFGVLVTKNV